MNVNIIGIRTVLAAALLGVAVVACDRGASDGTSGASGITETAPRSAAGSGTSGTGASESSSAIAAIDDSIITTKVKTALLTDADIKATGINVETRQGEVVLSGVVNNLAQEQKAVKLANAVEGVKKVRNNLTVKQ